MCVHCRQSVASFTEGITGVWIAKVLRIVTVEYMRSIVDCNCFRITSKTAFVK